MSAPAPCRLLEWDTEFFGRRIARIEERSLSAEGWARAREWCRANSVEALYYLASSEDSASVRVAEDGGFHLVDVRLTLEWRAGAATGDSGVPLRLATEADLPALRDIARESHTDSRFFHDPRFDRSRAAALYETWIERSCRGWADQVWVADSDGRPTGYVTIHREGEGGRVGLLAVGPSARGRGVGAALIRQAQRGRPRLTTVTQGRNVAAQRLYQRCGFVPFTMDLWYHRWFEGSP